MNAIAALAVGLLAAACGSAQTTSPPALAGYCAAAGAVKTASAAAATFTDATTYQEIKSAYATSTAKINAAAAVAPQAVSADWRTIRTFADQLNAVYQTASDLPSATSALQPLLANTAAVAAAFADVDPYTQTKCGFSLSTPTPTAG